MKRSQVSIKYSDMNSIFSARRVNLLLLATVLLMSTSCKKENFNFSHITNVEANPDYGLPLGTVRYSIAEILTQFDKNGYVEQEANGDLFYNYYISKDTVIFGGEIMKYRPASGTFGPFTANVPLPGEVTVSVPFDFPIVLRDSSLIFSSVEIKSGLLDLTLHSTTSSTIEFTMPSLLKNGMPFSQTVQLTGGGTQQLQLDLSGCRLQESAAPNTIPCEGTVTFNTSTSITDYRLEGSYATGEIKLKHFEGKMMPRVDSMVESLNFDLLTMLSSANYGVSTITLYDPSITLSIGNTFHINGEIQLQQLALTSTNNSLNTSLISSPVTFTQGYSPTMTEHPLSNVITQIPIQSGYETVRMDMTGRSTLNPGGLGTPVSMDEDSKLSVQLKVTIPFKLKMENAYFRDTLQLNLNMTEEASNTTLQLVDAVENLTLDITLTNTLPVAFYMQALVCDSTGRIIDSLFTQPNLMQACFNPAAPRKKTLPTSMNGERAQRLLKNKHLILRFQMDTGNQIAVFNASQYLQATLRGRIKCNLGELDITFLSNL